MSTAEDTNAYNQWGRKISLLVVAPGSTTVDEFGQVVSGDVEKGLDLSAFRIKFSIMNADIESPNNANIRVYNLSRDTVRKIRGEFSKVVLSAGYEGGNYGIVFRGTIKQFKIGRENATDSYLDIYAADGDIGYNQGILNTSISKGVTNIQQLTAAAKSMNMELDFGSLSVTKQNVPSIRGVVLMGMARARLRNVVSYLDSGWSIQDGKVIVTDNTGYRDGQAVAINSATGLVGVPEQTDAGIRIQCLLNSKIRIGGRVKLNNDEIAQLMQQNPDGAPIAYNQWAGFQFIAGLNADGMYRAFSVEHEGDTRGSAWYTFITCLSVNETAPPAKSVAPE